MPFVFDFMAQQTEKLYELSYLASPDLDEAGMATFKGDIDATVSRLGGSIREHGVISKKKLAYPVNRAQHAYLVSEQIAMTPETKASLDKELKLQTNILRYIVVALTEKFLKRLRERRVAELRTLTREAKEKVTSRLMTKSATEKPTEEKKVDIAEIEKRLDEILGREL